MTTDIILVFSILAVSVLFLVTEWIPMEVTALLVLGAVATTGLVKPLDALSGFGNPAVVTVWAVFILSGGLTRTGVANVIGRLVLKLSGSSRTLMVIVIMVCAGVLSAVMNNVAVAALMLPVVMDIARQTGRSPSRLLMPLAYGSLLGGLTTQIGTPPNILVSEALRENGMTPFALFDFTPVGLAVMAAGVLFMAFVGIKFLPEKAPGRQDGPSGEIDLGRQYQLSERMFRLRIPEGSALAGKSLAQSRIGTVLGLNVVGITRPGATVLAPGPGETLGESDELTVEGPVGQIRELAEELSRWSELDVQHSDMNALKELVSEDIHIVEASVLEGSSFSGVTIGETAFRTRFGATVLSVLRKGQVHRSQLQDFKLQSGDVLLLQGGAEDLEALGRSGLDVRRDRLSLEEIATRYRLAERLLDMRVPEHSRLVGTTLRDSRLGEAMGVRVLSVKKQDGSHMLPDPELVVETGDKLLVEGRFEDIEFLSSLAQLQVKAIPENFSDDLESDKVGLVEAMLSPHTQLAGKTLRQLAFREKYGLTVLAIWREGRVYRSNYLRDMALKLGDALLLHGPREKFNILGREPDFLVLTESAQETPNFKMAKVSVAILAAVLVPVMAGWTPIYIMAVIGAALMVLTRCLTMEEAYRAIEWKGIFLIAGMMPLGQALDSTGAARFLANGVVDLVGPMGPLAVMFGLMALTFLATCVIPTAALVVLMVPIVLNASTQMAVSPYSMMMAMAIAASASFMTPISHPANVMVMGPGGYKFADYLKAGIPLTLVVLATAMILIPVLWPFTP